MAIGPHIIAVYGDIVQFHVEFLHVGIINGLAVPTILAHANDVGEGVVGYHCLV